MGEALEKKRGAAFCGRSSFAIVESANMRMPGLCSSAKSASAPTTHGCLVETVREDGHVKRRIIGNLARKAEVERRGDLAG